LISSAWCVEKIALMPGIASGIGFDENADLVDRDLGAVERVLHAVLREHDIAGDDREEHRRQNEQLVGDDHDWAGSARAGTRRAAGAKIRLRR
jgi:hypothetical protein